MIIIFVSVHYHSYQVFDMKKSEGNMWRKVYVRLDASTAKTIWQIAERERREPRDQIAIMLEKQVKMMEEKHDPNTASTHETGHPAYS